MKSLSWSEIARSTLGSNALAKAGGRSRARGATGTALRTGRTAAGTAGAGAAGAAGAGAAGATGAGVTGATDAGAAGASASGSGDGAGRFVLGNTVLLSRSPSRFCGRTGAASLLDLLSEGSDLPALLRSFWKRL